ncbi:MAG: hypothetical protein Q4C03_04020 [bacterium]|nr:hypothetical protein [bacterium]
MSEEIKPLDEEKLDSVNGGLLFTAAMGVLTLAEIVCGIIYLTKKK